MAITRKQARTLRLGGIYVASLAMAFVLVAPFVWMVISSISQQKELSSVPIHWLPEHPTLENYVALFSGSASSIASSEFARSLVNSTVVALVTTGFCLLVGVPSSYAFTRLPFRGRRSLFLLIVFAQMLPSIALIIPMYVLMSKIELVNSVPGLVIVYSTFTLPFVVWVMTGYFQTVPKELEEAAMIDGAGRVGVLVRIVLPLALPGLAAATIFSLLNAWSEFFLAVVFTSTEVSKTMPVVISEFAGRFSIDYGAMNAAAVLGSLPPILFALLLQKYIVSGLTAGAVKG
ncbi:MAG: carbohydrate ABC transporter permease [Chloroflexi bacterium]|nr:carbohydrate ABC transporter permease [Chloroflexota bacterium]